jgi:GNAT superfamily N-acetyltransferase
MSAGRRFEAVAPTTPEATELIDELSAELAVLMEGIWPTDGRSNYVPESFDPATDAFVVGYNGQDPVCCGALRRFDQGTVEVKRMYVRPAYRSNGWGAALLAELERRARVLGYGEIVLETGEAQPAAMALYARAGYQPTAPWPPYDERDYPRCFRKRL